MRASRLAGLVTVAALAAGCFAMTPAQNRSLDEVRAFADDTALADFKRNADFGHFDAAALAARIA